MTGDSSSQLQAGFDRSRMRRNAADLIAPSLTLLAPFVHYIKYNDFNFLRPEILILLGGLLLLGAVTSLLILNTGTFMRAVLMALLVAMFLNVRGVHGLFLWIVLCSIICWFLRDHLTEIVAVVFAVLVLTTFLLPGEGPQAWRIATSSKELERTAQPTIIHLVLDEHLGVEGIPIDNELGRTVKAELKGFYQRYGFRLHGWAYSQYFKTNNSLANLFNFTSTQSDSHYFPKGSPRKPYVLPENSYFRLLADRGYVFRIYQSHYMDFCEVPGIEIVSCASYGNSIKVIEDRNLHFVQKSIFILSSYLHASSGVRQARRSYRWLRARLSESGVTWPEWNYSNRVGPLALAPVLERLRQDLLDKPRGTVFFAHLLTPHYPYIFDADCGLRQRVTDWLNRHSEAVVRPRTNTEKSRRERYTRYLEQLLCQQRILGALFDELSANGIFEEATVVVHGDHGSRIGLFDPLAKHDQQLDSADYVDHFSVLYAAKVPESEPGYNTEVAPLQNLLASDFGIQPPLDTNHLYLRDRRYQPMLSKIPPFLHD